MQKPVRKQIKKKKEEPYQKYDRAFQALFEEFREDIGIMSKRDYIANSNLLACQMLLDKKDMGLNVIRDYISLIIVSSNPVTEDIMINFTCCEYRKGFYKFILPNYFPVYLIVIQELEVIKPNYPLLLLGNTEKQEELWEQLIEEIKQEVDARDIEKLWKYMVFSIKRNIFRLKEGELMKKVKELSEYNESINRFFDDEFLGKILEKKDDEFLGKILEKKDDEFLKKVLIKKGKDFLRTILAELGEEVTGGKEKENK